MDIQSEGPFRALHDRDPPGECRAQAAKSELLLSEVSLTLHSHFFLDKTERI